MRVYETSIRVPFLSKNDIQITTLMARLKSEIPKDAKPLRFSVTEKRGNDLICEIAVLDGVPSDYPVASIYDYRPRKISDSSTFNVVHMVPTGVGAEIGGHAGDAGPAAQLLGSVCDNIILHPNVVNASDLNEQPANAIYVEGSVLTRLFMGTVGLQKVRGNRILLVAEDADPVALKCVVNLYNGARASCGFGDAGVVLLKEAFEMQTQFSEVSGRAGGTLMGLKPLIDSLNEKRNTYDAVALSSRITMPPGAYKEYLKSPEGTVNPLGGVEALLTHTVSALLDIPSAHSPQMITTTAARWDMFDYVEPSLAAEAPSMAYLYCILKGLHKSPKIVTDPALFTHPGVITSSNISCLVQPDRCVGLPTLAALEQGIPVIAVSDKYNVMKNDLDQLPWMSGQLIKVANYFEAAGVLSALKTGLALETLRRPLHKAVMTDFPKGK